MHWLGWAVIGFCGFQLLIHAPDAGVEFVRECKCGGDIWFGDHPEHDQCDECGTLFCRGCSHAIIDSKCKCKCAIIDSK